MKRAKSFTQLFLWFGLAMALLPASTARAWWNADWTIRKKITVDTGATGVPIAEPLAGAPVLVRLHDGNFHFAAAKSDGSDLRFVAADDRTPLTFHIEKFDSLLNEAFIWVRVNDVKPGTQTSFWLYYGNGGNALTRVDDVKGTYDADTTLVYHFTERGQPPVDASPAANNAQNAGTPAEGAMIGLGLRLEGHAAVTIPSTPALAWNAGAPFTWSAWVKVIAPQPGAVFFRRQGGLNALAIGFDGNIPFVEMTVAGRAQRSPAGALVPTNTWHHFAAVSDGRVVNLLLDGEAYTTLNAATPALNGPAVIGGEGANGAPGFTGDLDELQLARSARPTGFIKFSAFEQGGEKAMKLVTVTDDEQPKNWLSFLKTGYVGVILGSLSVDGWVVIGILAVMGLVSWAVMIGKAVYLNDVVRGNASFLAEWRHVATDLSVLDQDDAESAKSMGGRVDAKAQRVMHAAPLYRIYHIGVGEIRHRLAADRSSKVLSARSIQAIRASLDGGLVREMHRLSSQMVLLTIAISGGPFLGLLGTVVGVMITFAAVAAAGDVNVNAIAPGIAAALAATVAGLAVAIPSLFGYNYLLTRIKATQSDLHVFIDEFVAKMAEFYSETAEANRTITRAPFAPSEPTPTRK